MTKVKMQSVCFVFLATILSGGRAVAADPAAEVIAAEIARGTALRRGDATALASLLADDLRYTHSTGRVETKAEAVKSLATRDVVYERFVTSDHHAAVVTANVVALNGRIDQRKLSGGKASDARLLFLAIWRREGGAWCLVSLQTAATPPPG